jgi:PAS domain S-box-containing protein/diguanylate cyclase (GGDEF)-like protein
MNNAYQLLLSLSQSSEIEKGNMHDLIHDGLYQLQSVFSSSRAALWLFSEDSESLTCHADFFDEDTVNDQNKRIKKNDYPELFDHTLVCNTIIASPLSSHDFFTPHSEKFYAYFQLHSVLLAPIVVKGITRGFIFWGNIVQPAELSQEHVYLGNSLALLFGRAILAKDNLSVEAELQRTSQLMNEIGTMANVGGWEYEIATGKLFWTDETYRIHGLSPQDIITLDNGFEFYTPEYQNIISNAFHCALEELTPYELDLAFIDANGAKKWVRTTGKIRLNDNIATHVYGALEDITYQKQLLDEQHSTSENLNAIVDNLNDSLVTISNKGIIRSTNKVVEKMFGYMPDELVGKNFSILMPEPFASKHDKYMQRYLQTGQAKIIGIGRELPAIKKDGTTFPMELSISEVPNGHEQVFVGIIRDRTERKKAEKEIHQLAYYDDTTGLLNRNSFEKDLKNRFEKSHLLNERITVLLVNLDKFSQINLIYGEDLGDRVLQNAGTRFHQGLPSWATVYRSNTDNFYILFNQSDTVGLIDGTELSLSFIAEQIIQEINQVMVIDGHSIHVQASIGILDFAPRQIAFIDIKPLLELAVYNAKQKGGNTFVLAESEEVNILKRHSELSLAMQCKNFIQELSLVLQPQYSPEGKIVGSEVLTRWTSPSLGFISPAEFIPLAEKNGQIIVLGEWIIEKACGLLAQRKAISLESNPISVNISAKQIAQPNFVTYLLANLNSYKIPHSELILELTESALVADLHLVNEKMRYLKELGIQFSIDDFGTGYSSLSYIRHLPISELKIDKSFVDDIHNAEDDVPIINAIIQMGQALNLRIVGEGVETKEQLTYLRNHGCDVIQGYYFSKPIDCVQWLEYWQSEPKNSAVLTGLELSGE